MLKLWSLSRKADTSVLKTTWKAFGVIMTLIQILFIALLCLGVGLVSGFFGYPLLRFLLPIWAFLAGMSTIFQFVGDGFVGWTLGFALGLAAASLAYLFLPAGLAIVGAAFGASMSATLMAWVGLDSSPAALGVGLFIAIIFAALAVVFSKHFIILATACAGAVGMLTGLLLILPTGFTPDQIEMGGPVDPLIEASVITVPLWVLLSAGGVVYQYHTTQSVDVMEEEEEQRLFL